MLSKHGAKLNIKTTFCLRFEDLSVILLKILVILDVTLHSWVSSFDVSYDPSKQRELHTQQLSSLKFQTDGQTR